MLSAAWVPCTIMGMGHGVKESESDAMRWYGRAAAYGDKGAKRKCDAILQKRREQKRQEKKSERAKEEEEEVGGER